eukprot:EG_transcript_16696
MTGQCKFGAKCSKLHPSVLIGPQLQPAATIALPIALTSKRVPKSTSAPSPPSPTAQRREQPAASSCASPGPPAAPACGWGSPQEAGLRAPGVLGDAPAFRAPSPASSSWQGLYPIADSRSSPPTRAGDPPSLSPLQRGGAIGLRSFVPRPPCAVLAPRHVMPNPSSGPHPPAVFPSSGWQPPAVSNPGPVTTCLPSREQRPPPPAPTAAAPLPFPIPDWERVLLEVLRRAQGSGDSPASM